MAYRRCEVCGAYLDPPKMRLRRRCACRACACAHRQRREKSGAMPKRRRPRLHKLDPDRAWLAFDSK